MATWVTVIGKLPAVALPNWIKALLLELDPATEAVKAPEELRLKGIREYPV
jgi:hypothetical protein